MLASSMAQAGPMQDIGTASGPQCAGLDVNNSGYVVGACAEANGSASGFVALAPGSAVDLAHLVDRKSTRLNSSHLVISYAVFCLKKKKRSEQLPPIVIPRLVYRDLKCQAFIAYQVTSQARC